MNRRPAGARSFLRQIAEPIPRAVAPLISRGTIHSRGGASRSPVDLIPPILEANEGSDKNVSNEQQVLRSSIAPPAKQGVPRSGTSSPRPMPQQNSAPIPSTQAPRNSATAAERRTNTTALGPQSPPQEHPHAHKPHTTENSSRFEFATPHSFTAESSTAHSEAPITQSQVSVSQPRDKSGTRVHIGTIEVRIPAPPVRNSQPAVRTKKAESRGAHSASSRTAETLARGLAWSHGLVQG